MRETYNTNIPWIGKIPIEWKFTKLGRLTCIITDGTHQTPNYIETGYPFLSIKDISSGKIDFSDVKYISEDEHKSLYQHAPVKRGDFLFTRIGTLGIFVEVNTDEIFDFFVSVGMFRLKENVINHHFLLHYLNSPAVENYIQAIKAGFGTAAPKYNLADVKRTWIIVPPEKEQERIANFLDAKCAEIDALSDEIQSEIDTLEEYKRSVITEAVTKGLDKTVPMKDSGIEWAEKVPAHWKVMQNKYIMRKVKEICPIYNNEDILSLTMNGVIVRDLDAGGKMPASFNGYQIIHPGNLLMCLFDYDVTPRCIGLIKNEGLTSPAYSQFVMKNGNTPEYYYYYYLMIDFTKELLHLAKNLRHSFTEDQLGMINAPVPPIDEQIAIAEYLDKQCAEVDSIITQKHEQLAVLADYKKSVIYEYVTGKKEVPTI